MKQLRTRLGRAVTKKTVKKRQARSRSSFFGLLFFFFAFLLWSTFLSKKSPPQRRVASVISVVAKTPTSTSNPTPTVTTTPKKQNVQVASVRAGYCVFAPVLFYHHIEPLAQAQHAGHAKLTVDVGIFEKQLQYLTGKGYHTASVDTIVQAIQNHTPLADKTIALTFDDAYVDAYTYIFPLLKQYGMIGNFAIPTGLLNNPGYMNWSQLKEMVGSGSMFAYNHTRSHISLAAASRDKKEFEIDTADKDLQENLGRKNTIFFYPYGSFNHDVFAILKQHGYTAAFSTLPGMQQCEGMIMDLRRTRIGNAPLSLYGL